MREGLEGLCLSKLSELEGWFKQFSRVAIMLSGGVDSTTLLAVATRVLGPQNVVAVTINSPAEPPWDLEDAVRFSNEYGVKHLVIDGSYLLNSEEYVSNSRLRCYFCKKLTLGRVLSIASELSAEVVVEGTNADDITSEYRPGFNAVKELAPAVRSPYVELGIGKECVRFIAKFLGIPIHDKPASACLASRIPYGIRITHETLRRVRDGELFLRGLGFKVVRLRDHGEVARIEVGLSELVRAVEPGVRELIVSKLKSLGYKYVAVDLEGYRRGSFDRP